MVTRRHFVSGAVHGVAWSAMAPALSSCATSVESVGSVEGRLYWDDEGRAYRALPSAHRVETPRSVLGGDPEQGLNYPVALAFAGSQTVAGAERGGGFYVLERGGSRICRFDGDDAFVMDFGHDQLFSPSDMVRQNDHLYVANTLQHRVEVFRLDGARVGTIGEDMREGMPLLNGPRSLAFAPDGTLHVVADDGIEVFTAAGSHQGRYGVGGVPRCIRFDGAGRAVVLDAANRTITTFAGGRMTERSVVALEEPTPTWLSTEPSGRVLVRQG